jgi:predicted nuclease of predicted toxin-antitoxin system
MKFLLDQDVYAASAQYLRELGHDVVHVSQLGLSRAKDKELLSAAQSQGRIFVTRDRDFGHLVFVNKLGSGVLYLRILPSTLNATHAEIKKILEIYDEEELRVAFIVIEPGGHRIRRL